MWHYVIHKSLISVSIRESNCSWNKKKLTANALEIIHNIDYIYWHINQWSMIMIIIYAIIIQMNLN